MSGPTRDSIEGRVYLDLQNKSRREGRPNAELQQLHVPATSPITALTVAVSLASPARTRSAFGTRRPTRDVDFQALHLSLPWG